MKKFDIRIIGGILLVAAGILLLLQELDIIPIGDLIWPILFGAGGLVFLYVFLTNRAQWWALIPGCTLLGLAGLMAWEKLAPQSAGPWGATFFLGGIGLSFLLIYLNDREFWWAIIPAGTLFTVALVAGLSSVLEGVAVGGVLFLGLALTFAALYLVRTPEGRMKWALIPAAILLVIGLGVLAFSESLLKYLWPLALIVAGAYILIRAAVRK